MKLVLLFTPLLLFAQAVPTAVPGSGAPAITKRILSQYGGIASDMGYQAAVVLYLQVNPEGKPGNIQVLQSAGFGLDERAIAAVRQWEYSPAVVDGKPVSAQVSAEVRLESGEKNSWVVRRSMYTTPHTESARETLEPPRLRQYVAPGAGACKASSGRANFMFQISEIGVPENIRAIGMTGGQLPEGLSRSVLPWRYFPGTADGKPRISNGRIELECGAGEQAGERAIYRRGGGVSLPKVIFKVNPEYSEEARRAEKSGNVMLSVVVDPDGRASDIFVVKSLGLGLDEKAMASVTQWRFSPGMRAGSPVAMYVTVQMNFRLL